MLPCTFQPLPVGPPEHASIISNTNYRVHEKASGWIFELEDEVARHVFLEPLSL